MNNKIGLCLLCLFATLYGEALAQTTYVASPDDWTDEPDYQELYYGDKKYIGYTVPNYIYIKVKAVDNGNGTVNFYVRKSSGKFDNDVTFAIRENPSFSGSSLTNLGTAIKPTGKISKGDSEGHVTITPGFTSGSRTYMVLLSSSLVFYTVPIKITATAAKPQTPDNSSFKCTNPTYTSFRANWDAVPGTCM